MSHPASRGPSNAQVITFMVTLSFICALILSVLASALAKPKEIAQELDRSKQMMIAAKILSHEGYFLMQDKEGKHIPAKFEKGALLVPGTPQDIPSSAELREIYQKRFIPFLVDDKGSRFTFQEASLNEEQYLADYKKSGYYKQPYRLLYEILPNGSQQKDSQPVGYVIPVNGYGLWDAIYGYIALKPDGNTVIGISWYDQKETPGLGANIAEAPWQDLFPGKFIFQESADGKTHFKSAPIGILVVKGKVSEVLGDSPKSKSAVDGMAGATLTGNGVTDAYREVLNAYRPFLLTLHENKNEEKPNLYTKENRI
ncbi:NADH:ubiquinone reductase (Na(+)-transporting) subunit C [Parachlamydia sp. AcF125]|uniref:NADH:ubiquinone reductase (Na(+)-transporting) subunit C n=1 Tax=Parachlamydia sp. AcF125 TaxID=2795736 RepID=UPI001BC910B5|nr:NADH:ubiquinone reductase (Na(+)-transporting) subunit C [Parachlamydia sp. AcF125]MBS4167410.1 Na(+)-translocating NADH-quinone reductase subunit C [Parachlamydia sp. AcF125]